MQKVIESALHQFISQTEEQEKNEDNGEDKIINES